MNEFFRGTIERELARFVQALPVNSKSVPVGLIEEVSSRIEYVADNDVAVVQDEVDRLLARVDELEAELAVKNSETEVMVAEARSRGHKEGAVDAISTIANDLKKPAKAKKNAKDIAKDLEVTLDLSYNKHSDKGK